MEIKRSLSTGITAQNTESSSTTPSIKADIQKGIASAKDAFEVVQQNPTQATPNLLPAVQKEISAYMSGQDNTGGLFSMMMEYQKMMNKEAREDRKSARQSAGSALASKSSQLDRQNESIDQGMKEAGEKANNAMNEASLEFMIGQTGRLVKGDIQKDIDAMSKRLDELKNSADQIKAKLTSESTSEEQQSTIDTRYEYLIKWLTKKDDEP